MTYKCTACQADQPGVVTQATLEDRINKIQAAKKLLSDELVLSKAAATEHAPLIAKVAELQGQLDGRARGDSLREIGVTDAGKREVFEIMFASHQASNPEATWDEWMKGEGGARSNTMLAECFTTAAPPVDPNAPPLPANPLPPANTGGPKAPPGPQPAKSAGAQLDSFVNSAAYQSLSSSEKLAKLDEVAAQHRAQPS